MLRPAEEWPCGRAIGRALASHGITHVFAMTGGHVVPILDGCHMEGIRVIAFRDERSAAFAAAAYGALTRSVGVCVVTAGPGLTNAITGLAQAQHGNWPVLSIAGQAEASLTGLGALQELDQEALMRPVSKSSGTLRYAEHAAEFVERALRTALAAPRGHVHLSVPVDVLARSVPWRGQQVLHPAASSSGAPSGRDRCDEVLALLHGAKRPVMIAGPSLWQSGAGDALQAFVERSGIPAFTHEEARGLLPDTHALAMGSVIFRLNPRTRLLRDADVVLAIGVDADWRSGFLEPPLLSPEATTIVVSSDAAARRPRSSSCLMVHADEGDFLETLTRGWKADAARSSWVHEAAPAEPARAAENNDAGAGVHPGDIARAVERARRDHDANVVFDGGNIGKWAKQQVRAERPGQWNRLKGRFGAIGHGLPSAIVRRLTDASRPCVLVTGDGSFGYNPLELETCIREGLPVVVVVAVDGAWGSVQSGLASRLSARKQETFTTLPHTRFDQLAIVLGARGAWIEDAGALDRALDDAVRSGETSVIAVRTRTLPSPASYPTDGY